MASVNKLFLVGNLGKDPEIKSVGDTHVCEFSIASNEKWKNKAGESQEHTEWTTIVVWGKRAEICKKYLHKGSHVFVEGKKRTRSWEGDDGNTHYKVECIANDVQFLDKKGESGGSSSNGGGGSRREDEIPF